MIKLIAALLMLIDHIGHILYPAENWIRCIGRLSMPLFAFCVARGFYFSQKKGTLSKYVRNLTIFSLVSQPIFVLISPGCLNIGVTWLAGVLFLHCLTAPNCPTWEKVLCTGVSAFLVQFILNYYRFDYGFHGVLWVIIMYYSFCSEKKLPFWGSMFAIAFIDFLYIYTRHYPYQAFDVGGFLIAYILIDRDKAKILPKWFFYWFYPVHMFILYAIGLLMKSS